jgi:hypothetical protein
MRHLPIVDPVRGEDVHNVSACGGQARVQEGWYGDKEGSQGPLHSLPVLHNDMVALCIWWQHLCMDSGVNGEEGRGLLVSLPAADTHIDGAGRLCNGSHVR